MDILSAVVVALVTASGSAATLSPSDQGAIMKAVCKGKLEKDAAGWVCRDAAADASAQGWEQRWVSARRGRFVAQPDEWLVSLSRTCVERVCPAEVHVVRRIKGSWRSTHEIGTAALLSEDCVQFGGLPDGLDRLACLDATGPNQGFMSQRLAVLSFAGGTLKNEPLMQKDQNGECYLSPPLKEYQDDVLTIQPGNDAQTAFSARLQVRRAPCDPASAESHGPVAAKAEHTLRFVRSGEAVVPDPASAAVIEAEGWTPPKSAR